jgi:hypothetical protein
MNKENRPNAYPGQDAEKEVSRSISVLWGRFAITAWVILAVVTTCALIVSMWTGTLPADLKKEWFPKVDSLGVFGDAFGVVTSLVSLLTLFVAMRLYELQRVELEKTTEARIGPVGLDSFPRWISGNWVWG